MAGIKDTASSQHSAVSHGKTNRQTKTLSTRARASNDEPARVVRFPQLRGKVIRSSQFTHRDYENVLTINFTDESFLVMDIRPEPLVWPLDIDAAYVRRTNGKPRARRWDGLAEDK